MDELKFSYAKHPEFYPQYVNYPGINVGYVGKDLVLQKKTNAVEYIPYDYMGIMGVPITFLDKYNKDEFEIIGLAPERLEMNESVLQTKRYKNAIQYNDPKKVAESNKKADEAELHGEKKTRKKLTESGTKVNDGPVVVLDEKPPKYPYYTSPDVPDKYLEVMYARILIRRKSND